MLTGVGFCHCMLPEHCIEYNQYKQKGQHYISLKTSRESKTKCVISNCRQSKPRLRKPDGK